MTTEAETLTGRALDRAVGEALGWKAVRVERGLSSLHGSGWVLRGDDNKVHWWSWGPGRIVAPSDTEDDAWEQHCPYFSSAIANAFEVVAAMRGRGWQASFLGEFDCWVVEFFRVDGSEACVGANRPELPEAVCAAALRALAAEQEAGQ